MDALIDFLENDGYFAPSGISYDVSARRGATRYALVDAAGRLAPGVLDARFRDRLNRLHRRYLPILGAYLRWLGRPAAAAVSVLPVALTSRRPVGVCFLAFDCPHADDPRALLRQTLEEITRRADVEAAYYFALDAARDDRAWPLLRDALPRGRLLASSAHAALFRGALEARPRPETFAACPPAWTTSPAAALYVVSALGQRDAALARHLRAQGHRAALVLALLYFEALARGRRPRTALADVNDCLRSAEQLVGRGFPRVLREAAALGVDVDRDWLCAADIAFPPPRAYRAAVEMDPPPLLDARSILREARADGTFVLTAGAPVRLQRRYTFGAARLRALAGVDAGAVQAVVDDLCAALRRRPRQDQAVDMRDSAGAFRVRVERAQPARKRARVVSSSEDSAASADG